MKKVKLQTAGIINISENRLEVNDVNIAAIVMEELGKHNFENFAGMVDITVTDITSGIQKEDA